MFSQAFHNNTITWGEIFLIAFALALLGASIYLWWTKDQPSPELEDEEIPPDLRKPG